jgi:hypothetical protein
MDSALRTALEEKETSVSATLFGEVGDDMLAGPDGDPRRLFLLAIFSLIASACRLGGPRRLLGRSKVHGMSKEAQARHGIPDSSHCLRVSRQLQLLHTMKESTYLYFPKATGVAGLAQTISLLCIPSSRRCRWWWGNGMLRLTLAMSVCMAIAIC